MRKLPLLCCLALTGCINFPNSYAPDRERNPDVGPNVKGLKAFVEIKDASAAAHFAGGVNLAAFDGVRRKTEARAALRFRVPVQAGYKFLIDFDSPQQQKVLIRVNGSELAGESFAAGGPFHLERPLPEAWLVADTATLVEIESEAGIGLIRIGFVR